MPTRQEDIDYYRRRIEACVEQAARSTCPSIRCAHEELARLYRERLNMLIADQSRTRDPVVAAVSSTSDIGVTGPVADLSGEVPDGL